MASNIKLLRAANGMSQAELAKRLGVSVQSVVANEKHCSIRIAYKCAKIFKVNVFSVLGKDVFRIEPTSEEDWENVYGVR